MTAIVSHHTSPNDITQAFPKPTHAQSRNTRRANTRNRNQNFPKMRSKQATDRRQRYGTLSENKKKTRFRTLREARLATRSAFRGARFVGRNPATSHRSASFPLIANCISFAVLFSDVLAFYFFVRRSTKLRARVRTCYCVRRSYRRLIRFIPYDSSRLSIYTVWLFIYSYSAKKISFKL